ncbi:hypothetical protein JHW43_003155 [Diplocarpon mali]|nr:hypothetical protein JHW43_003155 [Diplocarpon mali]
MPAPPPKREIRPSPIQDPIADHPRTRYVPKEPRRVVCDAGIRAPHYTAHSLITSLTRGVPSSQVEAVDLLPPGGKPPRVPPAVHLPTRYDREPRPPNPASAVPAAPRIETARDSLLCTFC